ncbi:hypothetical protein [Micromonospora globispora]|uniref:hypothetical protein n=1 Tax=Micromonospora globispora TaxID=1450148 RepID=UPI0014030AF8|nr:hypothetical protein [Micromonospora globispora]
MPIAARPPRPANPTKSAVEGQPPPILTPLAVLGGKPGTGASGHGPGRQGH